MAVQDKLGRDTPPMINVYQYVSAPFWVNKNAYFYKYLYSTNPALEQNPGNGEGWKISTFGGVRSDGAAFSVPQVTAQQVVDYGLNSSDGITPVLAYSYRPYVDGTYNTPGVVLCATSTRVTPNGKAPYFAQAWWPQALASVCSNTKTNWPYEDDPLIGPTARLAFFGYDSAAEGRIPVYQYAYSKIWFPSYFTYSTSPLSYHGTGVQPSSAGPPVDTDGKYQIAFYASPPI